MASVKPTADPYRVLGVTRGAGPEQIKAAHRRLAKAYHPDGSTGDARRFLAVQEAYQLLSDVRRRREWDQSHAPGPVRAATVRRRQTGAGDEPGRPRRTTRVRRPRPAPGGRTHTWTAERVPWWEDFRPRDERPAEPPPGPVADEPRAAEDAPSEFDVFNRSSGAAWSSAARRHFRRGTDELPSRGVWRYRGTQVVTGAEARKVAAEEEEESSRR